MENKIDLRNKYVLRVLEKVNSLEKMTNTLSQVDSALFSQTGGAAPVGAAPEATINDVERALNDKATEVVGLNDQIAAQIAQVKTALGRLLDAVEGVAVPVANVNGIADSIIGPAAPAGAAP